MLSVESKLYMLSVVMLNVVMLGVVAPVNHPNEADYLRKTPCSWVSAKRLVSEEEIPLDD